MVVTTVGTTVEAMRVIKEFDGAFADANLHGWLVDDIAAASAQQRVPFIFLSGYGHGSFPVSFAETPELHKP